VHPLDLDSKIRDLTVESAGVTICSPGGIEAMFMAPDAETRAAAERKLGVENVGPPLAPDSR
jgi:hypothetical protein